MTNLSEQDEDLALWFTPREIRDHFEIQDDEIANAVARASNAQLRRVGEECINSDYLYQTFHNLLMEMSEKILLSK